MFLSNISSPVWVNEPKNKIKKLKDMLYWLLVTILVSIPNPIMFYVLYCHDLCGAFPVSADLFVVVSHSILFGSSASTSLKAPDLLYLILFKNTLVHVKNTNLQNRSRLFHAL